MKIIISPAKKMNADAGSLPYDQLPQFVTETEKLLRVLRQMDYAALKSLWRCNDSLVMLNHERLQHMDLYRSLTPAVLAYEGIQYKYMAPAVFDDRQFEYISGHLFILSGFYGLLRPLDGVVPYRLEMQARLAAEGFNNLYSFWGDKLADRLGRDTDFILNLASREYSRAVEPYLPETVPFITCVFGELKDEAVVEKGTMCKMARGEMVRWLAENAVTAAGEIRAFNRLGYAYCGKFSTKDKLVFIR